MQRRTFLKNAIQACAYAGATLTVPTMVQAASSSKVDIDWSLGWQSVDVDSFSPLQMKTIGHIPPSLSGNLFRNGPAKMQRGNQHYKHWFDGDGMVQQFSFDAGKVSHQGKFVQTEKYMAEQAAGKFLYAGAGTTFENTMPTSNNDSINTANTALLEWDNELLALWEGGSAYRLDPNSLSTKGIKTWSKEMQHMPFSAHPLIDPTDGSMWNFGFAPYAGKGMLFVYHIQPKTGIQKVKAINLPFSGYMHDFAQTQGSLIFLVPPHHFANSSGQTFIDKFLWQPEMGSRLLVVSKNDLNDQQWFELPAGFVFHFGYATEQNNELRVNVSWYEDASLMSQGMTELMATGQVENSEHAVSATIVANRNTKTCQLLKTNVAMEFPGFDEIDLSANSSIFGVGRKTARALFSSKSVPTRRHKDTLVSYKPQSGEHKEYIYDTGVFAEEPLLIKPKDTNDSWIVQTFLDVVNKQSGINIFNAAHIEAGPIGQATTDRTLPLGFHGTFIA
ncbi:carotenoid oxygenase family protein [Brumicola pallidula]|uniref:Uncharacterized protein n=1 Tax=Brumicola pallidula DSM 14239 = ACAM 615 TaxID=1121922 RepID=K6ZZ04_9ALTE|nr:carotenoid oxygenase family protein [Glaciecola pallidula]GAC28520.1 hypothetical protein GPAL_1656 [Glaciecola pallidula DSM 14239 = ACAM 615]